MKMFLKMLLPFIAFAGAAQAATPLVIIRFNQPTVHYENQLYNAVARAVAMKPDLVVDVVSYAPQTDSSSTNDDWQEAASAHTQRVVATLQQMGVPMARINVTGQSQPGLKYDETHVFVR